MKRLQQLVQPWFVPWWQGSNHAQTGLVAVANDSIAADVVTPVVSASTMQPASTVSISSTTSTGQRSRLIAFQCNICGAYQCAREAEFGRETITCSVCHSTVRMRAMMFLLAQALFGRPIPVPAFPSNRQWVGLGLSDWDGYAQQLAKKFNYTNTFYHQPPQLDILNLPESYRQKHHFIIASDVFEHVVPPIETAFVNAAELLVPGGFFLFSVPYHRFGPTVEHFPDLYQFQIETSPDGQPRLRNCTRGGDTQIFSQLLFHGGAGATLEMRQFGEADLFRHFQEAGFLPPTLAPAYEPFGILWQIDASIPMIAYRKQV